jgi:hypothetical protein
MLPVLFGHTGIWYAVIVAEVLAFLDKLEQAGILEEV